MEDIKYKEYVLSLIETELQSNLHLLIDPKQKNSFSQSRINVWKNLVKDRIYYHLIENK
jgi:hypothetical protein